MLVGSANDDVELVRVIEGDQALVVADNLCFGSRFHTDLVEEEGDPVEEPGEALPGPQRLPAHVRRYASRLNMLKEKVRKAQELTASFCRTSASATFTAPRTGSSSATWRRTGIPCMRLEREYGPLVETGRMKMRVDAFLERIGQRREIA